MIWFLIHLIFCYPSWSFSTLRNVIWENGISILYMNKIKLLAELICLVGLLQKQYIYLDKGNKIKSYYAPSVGPPLTDHRFYSSIIYTNDFSAPSLSYTLFLRLRTQFVDDYLAATAFERQRNVEIIGVSRIAWTMMVRNEMK